MANPNSDHLFEQAVRLAALPRGGSVRQVDLRRAVSAAYYGLFHFVSACLADEFVGVTRRSTSRYALVYRSIDHRTLRDLCNEVKRQASSARYLPYVPSGGFGQDLREFAVVAVDLQQQRHAADYDPLPRFRPNEATLLIGSAMGGVQSFAKASRSRREAFLTLLLCPPR